MRYQPSLQTTRLRLRPFVADDAPTIAQLAGTSEIAVSTISVPHPYSVTAAKTWVAGLPHLYRTGAAIHFALSLRDSKQLIGSIAIRKIDEKNSNAELDLWIGQPWQRQGFATESMQAVLNFAFVQLSLHRLYSYHIAGQIGPETFLKKLGFHQEGKLQDALRKSGKFQDIAISAILSES